MRRAGLTRVLLYIPVVLSFLVLGAHFLRDANFIGVFVALVLVLLLFVRRPWAARLVQVALVIGALEWLRTMYELAQIRAMHGLPYGRMLVILGVVVAVTLCSALFFQTRALKDVYRLEGRSK
jgi:hypothetical protein